MSAVAHDATRVRRSRATPKAQGVALGVYQEAKACARWRRGDAVHHGAPWCSVVQRGANGAPALTCVALQLTPPQLFSDLRRHGCVLLECPSLALSGR